MGRTHAHTDADTQTHTATHTHTRTNALCCRLCAIYFGLCLLIQLFTATDEYIAALAQCQEAEQQQFEADTNFRFYTFILSIVILLPTLMFA